MLTVTVVVTLGWPMTITTLLGHLLRDDLINPVKMSIRPSVRTYIRKSTIKLSAATNK